MFGWARTIQQRDGLGHIFGLRLSINLGDLTSTIQRLLKLHPNAASAVRRHVGTTGGPLLSTSGASTPTGSAAVKSTVGAVTTPAQSTGQQLQGLLTYLLGR